MLYKWSGLDRHSFHVWNISHKASQKKQNQIASIENASPFGKMSNVCRYSIISGNSGALLAPSAPEHRRVSLGSRQKRFPRHPGRGRRSFLQPKHQHVQQPWSFPPLQQVNCISTEFTPRKHGGEKGVPFRIQVDTFTTTENGDYMEHVHSSSCQVKVFKVNSLSVTEQLPVGQMWFHYTCTRFVLEA